MLGVVPLLCFSFLYTSTVVRIVYCGKGKTFNISQRGNNSSNTADKCQEVPLNIPVSAVHTLEKLRYFSLFTNL
jgi:hypothetical protein